MKKISLIILFLIMPISVFAFSQVELKMQFGQEGQGPGQMLELSDVAVDSDGKIYVADKGNKRIQVLSQDGKMLASWSSAVGDKWVMQSPSGIALYGDKVYVTDSYMNKVFIFNKDGKFIDEFGKSGSNTKEFDEPRGICVNQGIVYVADRGNNRVQALSLDGIYIKYFGERGEGIGELSKPIDVSVDHRGYLFVADSGNERIEVFDALGGHHRNYYDLKNPSSVVLDKNGFFVADADDYKIKKFDFEGRAMLSFGTKGDGPAQFREMSGISLDQDGNVYVSDAKKNNIQKFSTEKFMGIPPEIAPPLDSVRLISDINVSAADAVWDGNTLYATSQKDDSVRVIQQGIVRKIITGQGKERLNDPHGIAIDPQGFLWVVDSGNNRILKLDKEGRVIYIFGDSGSKEGNFSSPQGIAISDKGIIYIADSGNERVQVFNTNGVYMSKIDKFRDEEFDKPVDVDVDSSGNIFVVDEGADRVIKFSPDGKFMMSLGKEGEYVGAFREPTSIIVTQDEILVLDSGNHRVQVFDHKGKYLRKFGARGNGKGDFAGPLSISLKDDTTIYVSDPGNEKIQEIGIIHTPRTPLNVKVESGVREISINWPKNYESYVSHYNVYRSEDKLSYKLISSPKEPPFTDKTAKPGTVYFYKVSASAKNGNEGGKSNFVEAVSKKLVPPTPIDVKASPKGSEVALDWQLDKEEYIASYVVYKDIDGIFKEIGRPKTNSFTDKGLRPNTLYTYKITAVSTDGEEGPAALVKATTIQLKSPVDIKASQEESEIALVWQPDKEEQIVSYVIYKEIDGMFKEIGRSNLNFYTDKGLKPNNLYAYKITAISADGAESQGAIVRTTTILKKPPIDITIVKIRDIFPNAYRIYEREGIGRIKLTNNTNKAITDLKVSFMIKEFMNNPAEVNIKELLSEKSADVELRPIFNEKLLKMKENASVQSEIKVHYNLEGEIKSSSMSHTLMVIITERKYTAMEEKRFKTALQALDDAAEKKQDKEVVKKIKEKVKTAEDTIKKIKAKGLSYGETVAAAYLLKDSGRFLEDVLDARNKGQSWPDIISSYDVPLADVTDTLKEIEKEISKKEEKKKERARESEKFMQ